MSIIFEKNMASFKAKYEKEYVDNIISFDGDYNVEIELTKEDTYAMKLKYKDKIKYISSKYSPIKESKRFIDNINEYNAESVFVVFGMGSGYHILELFKLLTEKNKLIIVEPSVEIFKKSISINDFTEIIESQNAYFHIGSDIKKLNSVFNNFISINDIGNIKFLVFSQYDKMYEHFCFELVKELKYLVMYNKVEANTANHFCYEFNNNLFKNIDNIVYGNEIQKLKDMFKDKPAIIVSAGPSLDKNIKDLKKAKDKAVIITGGRTLNALLENNIIPDVVVSIDPGDPAYDVIEDALKCEESKIPLISMVISNNKVIKNHKGKQFFINSPECIELMKDIVKKDIGVISMGGSVANVCLSSADYMGCNPLILVGQDLAFTDGKKHAKNSKTKGSDNKSKELNLEVEDIYGNKVFTSFPLYTYLKWFENYIEDMSNKIVIDATEGGAKIKGTQIGTLNETINKYCVENIHAKSVLENKFECKDINKLNIKQIILNLQKVKKDILEVKKHAQKGVQLSNEMYKLYKNNEHKKLGEILNKLETIDNKILENKNSNLAINYLVEPVILNINIDNDLKEKINETEKEKGMRLAKKSEILYKGIYEKIDITCNLIDKSIKNLKESAFYE